MKTTMTLLATALLTGCLDLEEPTLSPVDPGGDVILFPAATFDVNPSTSVPYLYWTHGSRKAPSYELHRSVDAQTYALLASLDSSVQQYSDAGAVEEPDYFYRLYAKMESIRSVPKPLHIQFRSKLNVRRSLHIGRDGQSVDGLQFTQGGSGSRLVAAFGDGAVRVYVANVVIGTFVERLCVAPLYGVSISQIQPVVAVAQGDSSLLLLDLALSVQYTIRVAAMPRSPSLKEDGTIVLAGYSDGALRFWSTTTGMLLQTISGSDGPIMACAFSDDGSTIASLAENNTIRVYRATDYAELASFTVPGATRLAVHPKGRYIAIVLPLQGRVRVVNTADGSTHKEVDAPLGVTSVVFSRDNRTLIGTGTSTPYLSWRLSSDLPSDPHTFGSGFNCATTSDAGLLTAFGRPDGRIELWTVTHGWAGTPQ